MENSEFVSDAEFNRYISASHAELYELLVKANPDFYQKSQTLTGTGSVKTFACAADYYGTLSVDYIEDSTGGYYRPLLRIDQSNRNLYGATGGPSRGYRFIYNTTTPTTPMLELIPTPGNGETYRHMYTVAPSDLTADADIVDGVAGWEEYIVIDAAMKALDKEESTTAANALRKEKAEIRQRIEDMVENRTIGSVGRIGSVGSSIDYDPAYSNRLRRWRY